MKVIDLNETVYEITEKYPEVIEIMAGLGFTEMRKSAMRQSAGRITTIPKGARIKGVPLEQIIHALQEGGFTVNGAEDTGNAGAADDAGAQAEAPASGDAAGNAGSEAADGGETPESRSRLLKSYLRRLANGEELESVRKDFKSKFQNVDAAEIMNAEQEMMQEGTPLTEVQKLCDLHSSLFHGATKAERIMNAEKAAHPSLHGSLQEVTAKAKAAAAAAEAKMKNARKDPAAERTEKAAQLEQIPGHPLQVLTEENRALEKLLAEAEDASMEELAELLPRIREVSIHYAKKGDLLYPLLKVNYGVTGPSEVMWTVDDEIRDDMGRLVKEAEAGAGSLTYDWEDRTRKVLTRAKEMIYKEDNILFPICAATFSDRDWQQIYQDGKDYADCLGVSKGAWEEAEGTTKSAPKASPSPAAPAPENTAAAAAQAFGLDLSKAEIRMPGGHMNIAQLTAVLNTIPMEISFVDDQNINCFFNEGPKVFKRPQAAIGREVFSCHPPKIEPMVRSIIDDFRSGKRDEVPVWMKKNGREMLVRYMAVRDRGGNYLGTMELVQDMEFAKKHFEH